MQFNAKKYLRFTDSGSGFSSSRLESIALLKCALLMTFSAFDFDVQFNSNSLCQHLLFLEGRQPAFAIVF